MKQINNTSLSCDQVAQGVVNAETINVDTSSNAVQPTFTANRNSNYVSGDFPHYSKYSECMAANRDKGGKCGIWSTIWGLGSNYYPPNDYTPEGGIVNYAENGLRYNGSACTKSDPDVCLSKYCVQGMCRSTKNQRVSDPSLCEYPSDLDTYDDKYTCLSEIDARNK